MRICRVKDTGKLIEAQSGDSATTGTLITNAVNAGYVAADIEEVVVSESEWATIFQDEVSTPNKKTRDEEIMIQEEAKCYATQRLIDRGELKGWKTIKSDTEIS